MMNKKNKKNIQQDFYGLYLCLCLFSCLLPAYALQAAPAKTANHVFAVSQVLKQQVTLLRQQYQVVQPWPKAAPQRNKAPRHVLQKSLEVLNKINRLRKVKGLGAITLPPYPIRQVTPNEVFDMAKRLVAELTLLINQPETWRDSPHYSNKTPSHVYQQMWDISLGLDTLLGIRGFTPTEVFVQSEYIIDLVKFLRVSQNLTTKIEAPLLTQGRHPNHALQSAIALLSTIAQAERNLQMEPAQVPKLIRHVVTPTEVYDVEQNILAELHRIKYRLGIERTFPLRDDQQEKTPDDVIRNLDWAAALMPTFSLDKPLVQYDPDSLKKIPADVYRVSQRILSHLRQYRALKGIQVKERSLTKMLDLQPKHVYQKALETLDQVSRLRKPLSMGPISKPDFPLRKITPTEVYELVIRLDAELILIFEQMVLDIKTTEQFSGSGTGQIAITPSDVHLNLWKISSLLETLLGEDGYAVEHVYREIAHVHAEIVSLAQTIAPNLNLSPQSQARSKSLEQGQSGSYLQLVLNKLKNNLKLVGKVQQGVGISVQVPKMIRQQDKTSWPDLYNIAGILRAEVNDLKVHFGLTRRAVSSVMPAQVTPDDLYQLLGQSERLLSQLSAVEAN